MIDKSFETLSHADIEALVAAGRGEERRLEFKRELVAGSDGDKKEYLADLSSLANAQGGDLIFGVEESGGVASSVPGITLEDADREILRLEQLALAGLQPRILGLRSAFLPSVPGANTGVLIQRVPASLNAPHRVIFQNWGKFFTRHSRGKSEMDVVELREAFTASEGALPRLRALHMRLADLTHVEQRPGPQLAMTLTPLALARRQEMLEFSSYQDAATPPLEGSLDYGQTLEGFLCWSPTGDGKVFDQVLTHRAGYVEGLSSQAPPNAESSEIWVEEIAKFLRIVTSDSVRKLSAKGLSGPWVLMATLVGVSGIQLNFGQQFRSTRPSKRNQFDFREIIFDDFEPSVLISLMRQVWWAFGRERPADRDIARG